MAFIKDSSIKALTEIVDIVEVVDSYVPLKKSGSNFKARCPFHEEKTPSFTVSQDKQMFYCFGCGAGGNAIKFVMDYTSLTYPEAIEELASRYSFQLEYEANGKKKEDHSRKLEILEDLNSWFQKNLIGEPLTYILNRGVTKSSIQKFKIGFAPNSYDVLKYLHEKRVDFKIAEEVGIVSFDERNNPYSKFINRITFPIFSDRGQIIAFGGRTISNHPAKYLNSPTTKFFNKSQTLYGYNFARKEISKQKKVFIVEGYLDVILLFQSGLENVVAPLGTAFGDGHLPLFKKAGNPILSFGFDGDNAGVEATKRALQTVFPAGFQTRVTLFPNGVDPADFIKNGKGDEVHKLLENGKDGVLFFLETIGQKYNLSNPYELSQCRNEGIATISKLPESVRKEYWNIFAREILKEDFIEKKKKLKWSEKQKNIENKDSLFELSLIRSIIDNSNILERVEKEFGESGFKYYSKIYKDLKENRETEDIKKISIMDCNVFSESEIEIEILNYQIKKNLEERENILKMKTSFSEKRDKIRENNLEFNILKKKRSKKVILT
jgi:DNA primase